jgi:WD40 repeat protein
LWVDLERLHKANPLAVQVHPDGKSVLSSSADKQIVLTSIPDDPDDAAAAVTAAEVIHTATGPVLCLAVNPVFPDLVLAGDMAGGTVVFSIAEKKVVFVPVKHSKYVVRVAWSACGKYFATASYDSEAQIYAAVDSDGADATAAPYKLVKTLRCKGQVWPDKHTHKCTDTHTHEHAHHVALVLAHPYPLACRTHLPGSPSCSQVSLRSPLRNAHAHLHMCAGDECDIYPRDCSTRGGRGCVWNPGRSSAPPGVAVHSRDAHDQHEC